MRWDWVGYGALAGALSYVPLLMAFRGMGPLPPVRKRWILGALVMEWVFAGWVLWVSRQ